jgi:hypothetical protein
MWDWIHVHREDLQALGPLSTIIAAFTAAMVASVIGIGQLRIAQAQKEIAHDKLKLDLYGRRYAVYRAAFELSLALRPSSKRIPYEAFPDLQYTLQGAKFLFPDNVVDLTERIRKLSIEWQSGQKVLEGGSIPEEKRVAVDLRLKSIPEEMVGLLAQINDVFLPELSFKQLTGG